ncbi:LuxR C-terminal-related transcriptional regulator [Nocardia sp. CA-135953]|uniref:LuxR C-terminal-related transcriptional regulator n=1 Tax=Nocardia sp. CA-135953 TaxID=3239978 RepID=UPI003D96AD15
MTGAEARVAAAALRGEGLRSIAEELAVSANTVRTHLRRVFEKTGTHRQAEPVRVLTGCVFRNRSVRRTPRGLGRAGGPTDRVQVTQRLAV